MDNHKMGSREFGLVLGQQLLGIDDLHYGLWDAHLPLTLGNLPEAQQRYTDMILAALPPLRDTPVRVIDIGCGTGHILSQLLHKGYQADGLVPSPNLARLVRKRLGEFPDKAARLFECRFEDLPDNAAGQYDAALFSESYQYIPMPASFAKLTRLVKPGGLVVICDFFKKEQANDGSPEYRSFGGGHRLRAFHEELPKHPFTLLRDEDITAQVSPNIKLLDDILMNRLLPAGRTVNRYLTDNYPRSYKLAGGLFRALFRKKIDKQKHKYFSGHRTQEVFERYKTYHLIVLQRNP